MEGLISENIKLSLEEVVSHCFYINRIADRIVSILSVKFVMPNLANLYHHGYAHWAPAYADKITEYMDARDCTTIYGETPKGDQSYESPLECINKSLEMNLDLEKKLKKSILVAEKEKDYTTKVFLENALLDIIPITKDLLLLVDKMELYGDTPKDWMKIDHDITDFNIFGGE
jgi:ferritin